MYACVWVILIIICAASYVMKPLIAVRLVRIILLPNQETSMVISLAYCYKWESNCSQPLIKDYLLVFYTDM